MRMVPQADLRPGKMVVCKNCGCIGPDFNKCARCKKKIPEDAKVIDDPDKPKPRIIAKVGNQAHKYTLEISYGTAICPKQNQSYIQISLYFCLISSIYIAGRGKVYIEINTFERSHLKSREGQNRLSCDNLYIRQIQLQCNKSV